MRRTLNGLAVSSAGRDEICAGKSLDGLSLCAGVGGLDLGLHLALPGYRTVGYVEREAYAAATLVARMEDKALDIAPVWSDVATFDGKPWRGLVDIIHGGYPCQPFSVAGRKLGDKDPRHLWPHISRVVKEIEPALCFFENVGGHLRLGFEQVHNDLCRLGYLVKAGLFTAAEVDASHRRERLFILAYRECLGGFEENPAAVGYTYREGLERRRDFSPQPDTDTRPPFPPGPTDRSGWEQYIARWPHLEPAVCGSADGLAGRVDRLRLCGNGVVPLVAAYAIRTLAAAANLKLS